MNQLEVALVLAAPNLAKGGGWRCLLVERDGKLSLPTSAVRDGNTTLYVASALLGNTAGLKARVSGTGWVELTQYPLRETVEGRRLSVVVPYGAVVPEVFDLVDPSARWVPIFDVFVSNMADEHKQIIQGVLARM